jgi:hypothetical protein
MVTRNNSTGPQDAVPEAAVAVGGTAGCPHGLREEVMTALPGRAAMK